MEEQGQSITVVPMQPCHIEELERLEKECFSTPWSFDALVSELSNPLAVFRVAEIGGRVAGYVGMQHIVDEGYICNIAVFPQKLWFKNNNTVTFSDCGDKFTQRSGLIHFLKQKYSQIAVHDDNCSLEFDGDGCYRFAHLIRDFAWRKN